MLGSLDVRGRWLWRRTPAQCSHPPPPPCLEALGHGPPAKQLLGGAEEGVDEQHCEPDCKAAASLHGASSHGSARTVGELGQQQPGAELGPVGRCPHLSNVPLLEQAAELVGEQEVPP